MSWTQTSAPGSQPDLGEYYQDGHPVGRQRLSGARIGALEAVAEKASTPLPRLIGSAALAIGGALMAVSELSKGDKGHHTALGKWGRVAVGAGAAYWGFLYSIEALELLRQPAAQG